MRYGGFGRTGLTISTVSMGCNRLGDPGVDPAQWPPLVERALELGVTLFDTAISYNQGRSEAIVGEVTARHAARTHVTTKVGFNIDFELGPDHQIRDYSAAAMFRDVDGQLQRLRRDTIDAYMLHSAKLKDLEAGDWAVAVESLKKSGKIRAFGVSVDDDATGLYAIEHGADVLQIEYDLLTPGAEDRLLPAALKQNVGIMVKTPLARGLLTGKFPPGQAIPPEQQWRRPRGDRLQLRLGRIEQLRFLERPGQTLAQAALRFVIAHPAVHCAVPGARTIEQLEANLPAADGDLTTDELTRIKALHTEWRAQGAW